MRVETAVPSSRLRGFVRGLSLIETDHALENTILPTSSLVLSFRIRGRVAHAQAHQGRLPPSALNGIRREPLRVSFSPGSALLLVELEEGGAAAFFRPSAHEFSGLNLSLDEVVDRHALETVEEALSRAPDNRRRFALVETFLLRRLRLISPDLMVLKATRLIRSARGNLRISDLVGRLAVSKDTFEKRFRGVIGTTAKHYAEIVRLRGLIQRRPSPDSLTEWAYEAGYFDQSHFIKRFQAFTGQTPRVFFDSSSVW